MLVAEVDPTRAQEQTTAAARPVLLRCRVRLAPVERSGHLARVVPPLARWWFGTRSLGVPAFLSAFLVAPSIRTQLGTSCRPPAAPFAVLVAGRRLLPPSPLPLVAFAALMPDAAADPAH